MARSNKKMGNDFERDLAQILFTRKYWVHNLAQKQSGQPADLIAVYKGHAFLIDAKVCSRDVFDKRRIEPNQHTAMSMWYLLNYEYPYFAMKTSTGIYMVSYDQMFDDDSSTIRDFRSFPTLEEWLDENDNRFKSVNIRSNSGN